MKGPVKPKHDTASRALQQIEADKTSRLRALRLAKEAQDREAAARVAAATPRNRRDGAAERRAPRINILVPVGGRQLIAISGE